MTGTPQRVTRVRSMKARRPGRCQCGRLIRVGDRITRHARQWLCLECAITTAIAIAADTYSTNQTRTSP